MKLLKTNPIKEDILSEKISAGFIKFCSALSSSVEIRDFLLKLQEQIPKKFQTGELVLFYESEQLGLRRAYVKNRLFYEPSAQRAWPEVTNIRLSVKEENLYLAQEFGRPFFQVLMVPLEIFQLKALLVLELCGKRYISSLIDFFEERKVVLELSFKKVYWNTRFSRTSYLWSQLFSYWREPLAILRNFQPVLENGSFKKNLVRPVKSLNKKIQAGWLEQGDKVYQLYYYPLKDSLAVLYCQDMTKSFNLKEQLFQNEKKSLLFELGQNMAHQLNNPLTGVKAMTQVLKKQKALENFNEEFEELENAIYRSQKIIKSFLSFSDQRGEMKNCDIQQILEETLPLLKQAIKGIKLITDFSVSDMQIKADFSLLQQVFYNLILNAGEALAEDKTNKNPIIEIRAYPISKQEICLKIKDNGIGVEPEKLDKIFQPFWTSKKRGTGLGLGAAKKIVQSFNGKIFISSQKNQFTCFKLIFPLSFSEQTCHFVSELNESP